MTFTITTVYADGRTEVRDATPEEVAQREADLASAEAFQAERQAAEEALIASRASAISKLTALGLTDEEVAALIGQ